MYQASEKLNTAVLGNERTFRARITAGEEEATTGILSIRHYGRSAAEDYISIGDVVSSYVEIQMYDPGFGLENAEIGVSIGMLLDGEIEYVPLGLFTVQKPQNDDGVVTFTAYDRIQSKLSGAFFSELSYPADGKAVLQEMSEKTGVPIDVSSLPDGVMIPKRAVVSEAGEDDEGNEITTTTYTTPFDGYLYREALGYIAQFYCRFATVNRSGTVELRWYTDEDYTVGTDRYYDDLVTNELVFTVGTVTCTVGDTLLTAGTGTESIQLENPVMTQERLDAIYEEIKTLQFLPAGLSFYGDMRLELGDIVTVNDKAGNVIRLPVMSISQDFDGGLLTEIQSFGRTEQEASAVKGPTAQKLDRVYTDLFLVKELVGNKADFDYVHGKVGEFDTLRATVAQIQSAYIDKAEVNTLLANYATIDLANVQTGAIKTAMIDIGAVQTAQIADGAITDAKIVNLTANKITAGTLSVERLEIRGSTSSIVYGLNNITGALQAQNVDTLNGEILTPRTITADRIVANSITGNEIAAKTITANNIVANSITGSEIAANTLKAVNIDVTNLFAQDITATGTIRGVTLEGATGSFSGQVTASRLYATETGKISIFDFDENGFSADINGDGTLDYSFRDGYFCATVHNSGGAERAMFYMDTEDTVAGVTGRAIIFGNEQISLRVGPAGRIDFTSADTISQIATIDEDEGLRVYSGIWTSSEIQTACANAFRSVYGNYGIFLRNDGSNTYFLLTNSGDQYGSWNSLRPLYINNATGICNISGHASQDLALSGGTLTGKLTASGGIQLPDTGGLWLLGMTSTKCIVGSPYTSATGGSYHPVIRQNTALGNVFNLGGITVSSSDDRFGIFIFKSGRTANAYDYATYWNAVDGTLTHDKNLKVNGTTALAGNATVSKGNTTGDTGFVAERTDTGVKVWMGVGSGGTNHGIYSNKLGKWMVYGDASNVYLSGNAATATKWAVARTLSLTGSVTGSASIDGSGNVSITTSTNHTHSYAASSSAGGAATTVVRFTTNSGTTSGTAIVSSSTAGSKVYYGQSGSNSTGLFCRFHGEFGTTGADNSAYYYNGASDIRLKTNVMDYAKEVLPLLKKVKIREFDWIQNGLHCPIGFVADELEPILEGAVSGGGYEPDGTPDYKSINQFIMLPYIIKGMQELCTVTDMQDAKLCTMEAKYQHHESRIESLQYQFAQLQGEAAQLRAENARLTAELAQMRAMMAA